MELMIKKLLKMNAVSSKIERLEDKKEKLLEKIDIKRQHYYDSINTEGRKHNQALSALVLFRSMEGRRRALRAFKVNCCVRFWYNFCKCFTRCNGFFQKKYGDVLFKNTFLKVRNAVEPDLLLWQNFGVSKKNRCCRSVIFFLFVIFVLIVCFYGILLLENLI